jgi:hypothetical protein
MGSTDTGGLIGIVAVHINKYALGRQQLRIDKLPHIFLVIPLLAPSVLQCTFYRASEIP